MTASVRVCVHTTLRDQRGREIGGGCGWRQRWRASGQRWRKRWRARTAAYRLDGVLPPTTLPLALPPLGDSALQAAAAPAANPSSVPAARNKTELPNISAAACLSPYLSTVTDNNMICEAARRRFPAACRTGVGYGQHRPLRMARVDLKARPLPHLPALSSAIRGKAATSRTDIIHYEYFTAQCDFPKHEIMVAERMLH
jgi:hypothetical protein